MAKPEDSKLFVRRSIHIKAPPARVWEEFITHARMNLCWGKVVGES